MAEFTLRITNFWLKHSSIVTRKYKDKRVPYLRGHVSNAYDYKIKGLLIEVYRHASMPNKHGKICLTNIVKFM